MKYGFRHNSKMAPWLRFALSECFLVLVSFFRYILHLYSSILWPMIQVFWLLLFLLLLLLLLFFLLLLKTFVSLY